MNNSASNSLSNNENENKLQQDKDKIMELITSYFDKLKYYDIKDTMNYYEKITRIFDWSHNNINIPQELIISNTRYMEDYFITNFEKNNLSKLAFFGSKKSLLNIFGLIWVAIFKKIAYDDSLKNEKLTETLNKLNTLEKIIKYYIDKNYFINFIDGKNQTILFEFLPIFITVHNAVKKNTIELYKNLFIKPIDSRMNIINEKFEWIDNCTKKLLYNINIIGKINHLDYNKKSIIKIGMHDIELLKLLIANNCETWALDIYGFTILDYILGVDKIRIKTPEFDESLEMSKLLINDVLTKAPKPIMIDFFITKKRDSKHIGHRICNFSPSLIYTTDLFNQKNFNLMWNKHKNYTDPAFPQIRQFIKTIDELAPTIYHDKNEPISMLEMIFLNYKTQNKRFMCYDDENYLGAKLLLEAGAKCPKLESIYGLFEANELETYNRMISSINFDNDPNPNIKFELEARLDDCAQHWIDLMSLFFDYCNKSELKILTVTLYNSIKNYQNEIYAAKRHKKAIKLCLQVFKSREGEHSDYQIYSNMIQKDGSIILDEKVTNINLNFKNIYEFLQDKPKINITFSTILNDYNSFFNKYIYNEEQTMQTVDENEQYEVPEIEETLYELFDNYTSPQYEIKGKIDLVEIQPKTCPPLTEKAFDFIYGPLGENPTLESLKNKKDEYIFIYGNGVSVFNYDVLNYYVNEKNKWIYACRGVFQYTPYQVVNDKTIIVDKNYKPFIKLNDFFIPADDLIKVVKYKKARVLFIIPEVTIENGQEKQIKFPSATNAEYLLTRNRSVVSGWHCQDGSNFSASRLARAKEGTCYLIKEFES